MGGVDVGGGAGCVVTRIGGFEMRSSLLNRLGIPTRTLCNMRARHNVGGCRVSHGAVETCPSFVVTVTCIGLTTVRAGRALNIVGSRVSNSVSRTYHRVVRNG